MKKSNFIQPLFLIVALSLFSLFACNNQPPEFDQELEVPNFGLIDQNGDFHQLYYYSDSKAIVLYVQGNGSSTVRNDVPALKASRKEFKEQPVKFLLINPNLEDDRASIVKEAEEYDIEFPIMMDVNQLAAEALQLYSNGEAIVIDPYDWTISYRGPITKDDTNMLSAAIGAQLEGSILENNFLAVNGDRIKLAHPDQAEFASISYSKEIAPLLKEKCMACHVEGGIAPWAMKNYEAVFGWSHMIREVVRTQRMPPWQADPHYGVFEEDMSLSPEQVKTLVHWIDAGAKKDGEEDPLIEFHVPKEKWELGEPDIKITLNKEDIPANGIIDYRYQEFDLELEEDIWATAIQVMPDNKEVLHHLLVSVIYPDGYLEPIDRRSPWLDGLFAAWAPGQHVEEFPEHTGRILPAGSKLHFQLHYTSNGKAQSDESTIGIYVTDEKPEKEYLLAGAFNPQIVIPPNESQYENRAKYLFEKETTLYSCSPHMHFRGKAMKFTALYPDGTREVLLNVPHYNFNWQRSYRFKEPKVLPARTVVYVDAVYDNSSRNSFNPDAERTVYWGDYSFDEMLVGYMSFEYGKRKIPDSGQLSMK